jgi:hypothetical protein
MRNLLAFLGAALVVFLGLGWYLDWHRIQSTPKGGGHRSINIDVNTKKIGDDVNQGISKGKEILKNERGGKQESLEEEAESSNRNGPGQNENQSKKDTSSDLNFSWPPRPVPQTGPAKNNK